MNPLLSINFEQFRNFLKNNVLIYVLAILNIVIFIFNISLGNSNAEVSSQIDSTQLNAKHIETQINQLNTINNDLNTLKQTEEEILDKCLNFGKKTSIYKFLTKINLFLKENTSKLNVSISNSYNLTQKQSLSLDQNLQNFNGNYVIVDYLMTFRSSFQDMLNFLKSMHELPYFITLKQMDIKIDTKASSTEEPLLNVNLTYSMLGKIKIKEA